MDDERNRMPDYRRSPATFGPKVREPQETLQIRNPRSGGTGYDHPFKLLLGPDDGVAVGFGVINLASLAADSFAANFMAFNQATIVVNGGTLSGGPDDLTGGELAVAPSTTYGVWFRLTWITSDVAVDTSWISVAPDFASWILYGFGTTVTVVSSTTYTVPGDQSDFVASTSGYSYIYIGKVVTDADGVPTFSQHLRSDLTLPAVTLPFNIISSDGGNAIVRGTDDGLFYEPL